MMRAGACGPTCACCYPDRADACERFKDDDVCDAQCVGETGRGTPTASLMGTEADGTLSKVGGRTAMPLLRDCNRGYSS